MKFYRVAVFDEDCLLFWFTVMAKNLSDAHKEIEKEYYMNGITFSHFEITEV